MRSLSVRNGIKGASSQITTGYDLISDWEAHERQHMRSAMAAIGDFPVSRHSSSHHRAESTESAVHHSLSGPPSSSVFPLHKPTLPAASLSSMASVTANPTASSEGNHSVMSQDMSYASFVSEQLPASKPQIRLQVGRMPTIISQSPSHTDETRQELSPHPYAYGAILPSSSTPLSASPDTPPVSRARPRSGFLNGLKSSISTPNLRHNPFLPKAKEKWFAAQTWCDAFFFPRPRFRVHTSNAGEHLDKGKLPIRMMSPAESSPDPGKEAAKERSVYLENQNQNQNQNQNKTYRSQSTADLLQSPSRPDNQVRPKDHLTLRATVLSPSHTPGDRPRSFALDDLALPSPAPSLARVLAEGEQLQLDRQAWQRQASHSFQNKRSRSLSRLRAKSLSRQSQSQFNTDRHPPTELLAARTLLGQQLDIPHIRLRKPPSSMGPPQLPSTDLPNRPFLSTSNTQSLSSLFSKKHSSHTHSNSQSTQASRIRPRATSAVAAHHSRTMSLSRKIAGRRGTTAADSSLRIMPPSWPSSKGEHLPPDMSANVLTLDAVRLATNSSPKDQHQPITSASPTPSSSSGFGIAVSSPSFPENGFDKELEQIHIRAHPYAQGHDYYSHSFSQSQKLDADINPSETGASHQHSPSQSSDFAGPHPSIPPAVSIPVLPFSDCPVNDIVMRHRLPPQVLLRPSTHRHPYSNEVASPQGTNSDDDNDMIPHPLAHSNSSIPPPAKLYAEFSTPGGVHEVLPEDIRYSPYVPTPAKRSMPGSSLNRGVSTASRKQAELDTATTENSHAYAFSGHDSRRNTRLGMDDVLEYALRRNECSGQEALGWASLSISSKARNPDISSLHLTNESNPEFADHIYVPQMGAPNVIPMDSEVFTSPPKPPQALSSSSGVPHASFKRLRSELSDNSGSTSHSGSIPQFLLHPLDESDGLDRFDDLFVQPQDGYPGHSTTNSERKGFAQMVRSNQEVLNPLSISGPSAEDSAIQEHNEIHASSLEGDHNVERYPVTLSISHLDDEFSPEVPYRDHSRAVKFSNASNKHDLDNRSFTGSESSVVSSTLRFSPTDETFGIRMGFVDTSLTPPIITSTQYQRNSNHAFPEDANEDPDDTGPSASLSTNLSPHLSLPRSVSDGTRASFMTSGTDTSHISNLSDFPAPPSITPAHMSVLQSYFDESPIGETGRYSSSKR